MMNPISRVRWWITKPRSNVEQVFAYLKAITVGVVVTTAGLAIVGLLAYRAEQNDDEQAEKVRIERAVEACENYNIDQTHDRAALNDMIPRLALITGVPEDQIATRVGDGDTELGQQRLDEDEARVAEQNPYRQCSVECVERHTDPNADKCPPAANEEGTEPLKEAET